jgi:hypothetical protein
MPLIRERAQSKESSKQRRKRKKEEWLVWNSLRLLVCRDEKNSSRIALSGDWALWERKRVDDDGSLKTSRSLQCLEYVLPAGDCCEPH